ncbi:hypothetical protein [Sandaracinus amylolyticus]|uniref:hypothetical protein n=1 Tax=Sandaracinus amylolyticus TaxID=927083 RepID=UPI001F26E9EA|nr:hypothetical protein [Sandaracinus amylolyticus]UJR81488.1 Hypothetical protein I5071_35480 [Sandaracinus amylolyticus]
MTKRAMLKAAEEVLAGTIGGVRTVDAGSLERGAYAGVTDEQLRMSVLVKASYEVEVVEDDTTGIVANESANLSIDKLTVRVRLAFSTESELNADERLAVRATAFETADTCRDALAFAGNLHATSEGVLTRLAGDALNRRGPVRTAREDWAARIYVVEFLMTGLMHRVRAVA